MRILFIDNHYQAQFTLVREIEQLAEYGDKWISLVLPSKAEVIGEIHASTHEIRLFPGVTIGKRQVVNLRPPDEAVLSL
jgi:hypothetical protein